MKIYRQIICSFLLFAFLVMVTGLTLASDVNVEKVGYLGGPINAFDAAGNYAYIGQGQDFVVLDNTNPFSPALLGRVTTKDNVNDIKVSGNYAYVADGTGGLLIIDISNPLLPTIKGKFDTVNYSDGYSAYRVSVSGSYAYITFYHYSNEKPDLLIIDISNPSSPVLAGSYSLYNGPAIADISVSGNYAYSVGFKGFSVIDISNPSDPILVGSYDSDVQSGTLQSGIFSISGNYAYFANGFDGLLIVDISNPSSPVTKGSCNNLGYVRDVSTSGNYAYITTDNGLRIIDISDPSSPTLIGSCTERNASRVWIFDNYLYVNSEGGLDILDIGDPSSPVIKGKYSIASNAQGISVSGNYAYIADGSNGIDIIDISNPSFPIFKGICDTDGYAYKVSVSGNYAYVADGTNGLVVVDISNPSFPFIKGRCDLGGYTEFVSVSGDYAYVNGYIIDISNPSSPTIVGSCKGNHDISVSGNYAYCTWYSGGFDIYDVSKPSSPVLVGSYDKGSGLGPSISVSGNYAYFMGGENEMYGTNGGFWVIDVSNSSSPTLMGGCPDVPDSGSISISSGYAAVGGAGGLYIVNVGNPSSPILAGTYGTNEFVRSVSLQDKYAYLVHENGFVVLKTDIQNSNPANELEKMQNNLNNVSKDTTYMYPVSEADIQNYINQGYNQTEINQKLQEKTVSDKQGRVLGAYIDSTEDQQQKEDIEAIINKYPSDYNSAVVEINRYADDNIKNPSHWRAYANEKFYSDSLAVKLNDIAKGVSTTLGYLSYMGSEAISTADKILSSALDLKTQNEIMEKLDNSEGAYPDAFYEATDKLGNIVAIISNMGAYNLPGTEAIDKYVTIQTKVTYVRRPYLDYEWKYIPSDVLTSTNKRVFFVPSHSTVVYEDEASGLTYVKIPGRPNENSYNIGGTLVESGYIREITLFDDGTWKIVPISDSSSNLVSNTMTSLADVPITGSESDSLSGISTLKIYNYSTQDIDGDGFDEVIALDIIGNGKQNFFNYDPNKDGFFEIWRYIDADNNISVVGYDITRDGKTEVYDTNGDGNCDAWDLDGNGIIDQIDSNNDGKVDAYDSNNDGNLDIFVEYDHEIISWINSPSYGETFAQGEPVLLNGSVFDGAKKAISPYSFIWSSNLDNLIGKGENISLSNLSPGNHTITLTVEDSNGSVDQRNVLITISHGGPLSITNIQSISGTTWLNWTWTNPSDSSFNHTEIYLNDIFQANTSDEYYNATGLEPDTNYTLGTRTADINGNVNETWVNSTAKTGSLPDSISPVIESVILFPANTTAGSRIDISANITDNIGVAEVTAGGLQLLSIDGNWQGNITAPSSPGKYSLSVEANDSAGNTVNTSVPYFVARRQGGINVAVLPGASKIVKGDNVTLAVKVKNTQNVDDTFKVRIDVNGLPAFYRAGTPWFDWTEKTVNLRAKQEVLIPIEVTVPAGTVAGLKLFRVKVNSEKFSVHRSDIGYLVISHPRSIHTNNQTGSKESRPSR